MAFKEEAMISIILYMAVGLLLAVGIWIKYSHLTLWERIFCLIAMPFVWPTVVIAMAIIDIMEK